MIDNVEEKTMDLVVILAKYANFADLFNKVKVDVLPEHTQHDLAIETKNNKISLFSLTYNHSRLKLEVLREYIDEMLVKKFIVLSKSLLGVFVLFTKKSDKSLCICIDF